MDGLRDCAWHDGVHRKYWEEIVKALTRRLDGHRRDAEDLAQQTFMTAWQKRAVVPDDPRPWLYATARNHLNNHLRKWWRSAEPLDLEMDGGDGGIGDSERELDLRAALRHLSRSQREVLQLGYLQQFTIDEIAGITNMTPGAVKQRLHRARQKLRDVLGAMERQPLDMKVRGDVDA